MPARPRLLVLAFDDARESGAADETRDRVLGVATSADEGARAEETRAVIGFARAFPTFARAFGDASDAVTDARGSDGRAGTETAVAWCADARFARARSADGSVGACARASGAEAARRSDEALRACVRTVVREGERLLASGESGAVAWERAARAGLEALLEEEAGGGVGGAAAGEAEGFEKGVAFYAVEGEDGDEGLRMRRAASESSKRVDVDPRTASTLARLRRDVRRARAEDVVEHAFIKPGHEAWVCVGSRDGEHAYIVVEDTSDTLLRAVKGAKKFAEKAFPGAFDLELDSTPLSRANSM